MWKGIREFLLMVVLSMMAVNAGATNLFSDNYGRANNNDIDAVTGGMSGTKSPMTYVEAYEGSGQPSSIRILSNQLNVAYGAGMSSLYLNNNFTGSAIINDDGFSVSLTVVSIYNSTDPANRFGGFGVGNTLAQAQAAADSYNHPATSFRPVTQSAGNAVSDFYVDLARDQKLRIWNNGVILNAINVGAVSGTIKVNFYVNSFNAGSPVTAMVYFNGFHMDTRSFTWDQNNANYIGISGRAESSGVILDNLVIETIPVSSKNPSGTTLRTWGGQSMSQLDTDFLLASGLYALSLSNRARAYAWPQETMFGALTAAAKVDARYLSDAENVADLMRSNYWCTLNNIGGYNAVAGGCAATNRYFDDNAWIAIELMELYDLNQNTTYRTWAQNTIAFCMYGQNADGSIRWRESGEAGSSICASAPTCLANLMMYRSTGTQSYYTNGLNLYNWLMSADDYRNAAGLFHELNQGPLGYLTATVVRAAVVLYELTGDTSYLNDAQNLAAALETAYVDAQTGKLTQAGKWGGHDMTCAYVELYEMDGNQYWLDVAAGYLKYLQDNCKSSGRYPEFWGDTTSTSEALIDNAAVAKAYWTLGRTDGGN